MNFVISICSPGALGTLNAICEELELPLQMVLHGRGTAVRSMLDLLGIEDTEKRVVLTVANGQKTEQLIEAQKQRMFIGVPGHGLIAAVPIKSIGGGKTVAYLNGGAPEASYTPQIRVDYELIVVIANEGRTDLVMNAARSAGATGGTVLHGKGTGAKEAEKFLNVSLAREKEILLILAKTAQKASIMKAILEKAGPGTEAGAVTFSLPTSAIAGFGLQAQT